MPTRFAPLLGLLVLPVIAGCTPFPDIDAALSPGAEDAAYPALIPVERIRARAGRPTLTAGDGDTLTGRADALRSRAARLRAGKAAP